MSETTTPLSSSPGSSASEKVSDDPGKLRTFLSILRKFTGVADIASVRFSLPAQLLEPTPNLEYWNYLDRPDVFASIGKSDDELSRMFEVLRFWFTKDLKYIKGKPCKPYNSTLGEFFRCNWMVEDTGTPVIPSANGTVKTLSNESTAMTTTTHPSKGSDGESKSVVVSYLTEQTSHHPPVSAFYIDCPQSGVIARGFDQLSAKFTGTSIRVGPGQHNLGIFVTLQKRDNEEYQLTHPAAHLGGLLRGSLSISVTDSCYVTCAKTRIKVILQYLEDGWVGRSQSRLEGVVFRYDPENDNRTKIKDVPQNDVLARIHGCWREKIYCTVPGSSEPRLIIDIAPLYPATKIVPPGEYQLPNESRQFWSSVTTAILEKKYGEATKHKQEIEERQRQKAAERAHRKEEWKPRFFTGAVTPLGKPALTDDGRRALLGLHEGNYHLEENKTLGA